MIGSEECDWPEDADHENGQYFRKCICCASDFIGHKRRHICRRCQAASDAHGESLSPKERAAWGVERTKAIVDYIAAQTNNPHQPSTTMNDANVRSFAWLIRVRREVQSPDDVCRYNAQHGAPVSEEHVRNSPSVKAWVAGAIISSITPDDCVTTIDEGPVFEFKDLTIGTHYYRTDSHGNKELPWDFGKERNPGVLGSFKSLSPYRVWYRRKRNRAARKARRRNRR